ncbi:hypothetical protein JOQ06_025273, partial [Pogonophryne albipinna]
MFSAVVLVLVCLMQMKLVTTEGHRGTNRHVFYAVQMDRGIRAARALAEQHTLEFIQQECIGQSTPVSVFLSACLSLIVPHGAQSSPLLLGTGRAERPKWRQVLAGGNAEGNT